MIDLDWLEQLHREGLRHPEGVEYDVACREAFVALPELLRLARCAHHLEAAARQLLAALNKVQGWDGTRVGAMIDALRAALAEEEDAS